MRDIDKEIKDLQDYLPYAINGKTAPEILEILQEIEDLRREKRLLEEINYLSKNEKNRSS